MSNQPRVQPNTVEPFEDRVDFLFRELELSIKWQRPSILFAIYSSEYVHRAAEADLEIKLVKLDQKVVRISIDNKDNADLIVKLSELASVQNAVFFISGLRWGGIDGADFFIGLNNQREFFVEKQLRLVFWLTEKEVVDLANKAPDFWAFRHRVIEFADSPNPELILQNATEAAWQATGEYTDPDEDLDAKISFRESLLTNLPEGNESASVNGNLLLTLGILHWRKGDYEKASEFLKAALEVAVSMKDKIFASECFNAIALVETGMGRTNEAIAAYQRAIQLAPTQLFPWNNLGILFNKLNRNEEALIAFHKATENKPSDAVSWNGLGDVYMKLSRPDEAIHSYLKAIELTPKFPIAWTGLGNAYFSVNSTENAFKAYQKAFTLNNRSTQTIVGLAKVLALQGRENNAIQAYEAAINIDPKNATTWDELGKVCLKAGSQEKAVVAFGKAIEIAPQTGTFYFNQAQAYLELGVHLEAIPLFEKSLTLLESAEEKASVWNKLGDAFRQVGDYSRAVSAYQAADEFNGKATTSLPDADLEVTDQTEIEIPEGSNTFEISGSEIPVDFTRVPSSLDSKESRVETTMETESVTSEISEENDEVAQVLDGDHLVMLDKSISEIEEILSRQNNLIPVSKEEEILPGEPFNDQEDSEFEADKMNAQEWNELGNTHLVAGEYDEAIFAYTHAIEMAPDFNWPYIKNLAMAYYQKGKNRQEDESDASENAEDNESPGEDNQDLGSMHELHQLSDEIFSINITAGESDTTSSATPAPLTEIYSLDSSSIVEPFSFDVNSIEKDLLLEAMQEDMEFNSGRSRDAFPASQELVEMQSYPDPTRFKPQDQDVPQVEINPGKEKFEVQPKNAYEWNELGNIYLKIGSNDKAVEAFTKAIKLDPCFGWAYSNLALAHNHSKKFKESIPLYKKSIELLDTDKGKAISFNRLGDVYRHMNDQENAMKAYQMASDLDGNTIPILARARMVLLNNV